MLAIVKSNIVKNFLYFKFSYVIKLIFPLFYFINYIVQFNLFNILFYNILYVI